MQDANGLRGRRDDRADHPAVRTEIANLDTRLSTETAGARTEIASLETRLLGEAGLELVGSDVIAVLEASWSALATTPPPRRGRTLPVASCCATASVTRTSPWSALAMASETPLG